MPRFTRGYPNPWRRRFPRARFRRRSLHGTLTPRLQVCQFNVAFDSFVGAGQTDPTQPQFNIQAMCPWSNVSMSGYDRSLMIHGIVFDLNVFAQSYDDGGGEMPGLPGGARAFAPIASWWFVDAADGTDAPTSLLNAPYGPWVSLPPVTSPMSAVNDSDVLPTRIIRRKTGRLKVATQSVQTTDTNIDAAGYTRFQWSGTIRKRFAVDDRQGLYWALWQLSAFAPQTIDQFFTVWLNGHYYYSLRR